MKLGKKHEDPAVEKLREQVKNDAGRLRWRLAAREFAGEPADGPQAGRKTGKLYDVVSSCLADANLDG